MGALKDQINQAVKDAMRQGEKARLGTLRMVTAAIKQREVDERIEMDDTQVLAILDKMVRERRDAIEKFKAGQREDLVAKESAEIDLIQLFLPTPLTEAEVDHLISTTIGELSATSMKDMGKVMAQLKPLIQGRFDAALVSSKIKQRLSA